MRQIRLLAVILVFIGCKSSNDSKKNYSTWPAYAGGSESIHYSSLTEIDTSNVSQLQEAWVYHTGDADPAKFSMTQCTPIVIDSVLYGTSPGLKLFAVNAGTGKLIWEFNPDSNYLNKPTFHFILNNNRGITYWTDGKEDQRIFFVASSLLHCIDARTGKLISSRRWYLRSARRTWPQCKRPFHYCHYSGYYL